MLADDNIPLRIARRGAEEMSISFFGSLHATLILFIGEIVDKYQFAVVCFRFFNPIVPFFWRRRMCTSASTEQKRPLSVCWS